MKILIVEDDADLREITERSLLKEHYVVETAKDYDAATSKIGIYEYDCILLDIMLPDGNGLDLLREYKRKEDECRMSSSSQLKILLRIK